MRDLNPYSLEWQGARHLELRRTVFPRLLSERADWVVIGGIMGLVVLLTIVGIMLPDGPLRELIARIWVWIVANVIELATGLFLTAGLIVAVLQHRRLPRTLRFDADRREATIDSRIMPFDEVKGVFTFKRVENDPDRNVGLFEVYMRVGTQRILLGEFADSADAELLAEQINNLMKS